MINSNVELITPSLAERYLSYSVGNRNLRRTTITKYANDIREGKWELNGQSIVFSKNGVLRDGHHRLSAIIEAGIPAAMLVTRGVDDDVSLWDRGIGRSTNDIFKLAGKPEWMYSKEAVAVSRWCSKHVYGYVNISDFEIAEFEEENASYLQFIYDLVLKAKSKICKQSTVLSAILFARKYGISEKYLKRFLDIVDTGFYDNDSELSAVTLRNSLLQFRTNKNRTDTNCKVFYMTQEAIASYVQGYPRKKAFLGKTGVYSDEFTKKLKGKDGGDSDS